MGPQVHVCHTDLVSSSEEPSFDKQSSMNVTLERFFIPLSEIRLDEREIFFFEIRFQRMNEGIECKDIYFVKK